MTDEELEKIRKRAKQKAKQYRLSHEADDFGSYATVKTLEGAKGSIDQLWIDYLRENYGDTRSEYRKDQKRLYPKTVTDRSLLVAPDSTDANVDFGFIQRFLCDNGGWFSSRDRAVMTLKYQWSLSNTEIAEAFGITVSRVSQILGELETRIRLCIEAQIEGHGK